MLDDWNAPPFRLNVYGPVPPLGFTVILPLFGVVQGILEVGVLPTVMVTPVQGFVNVRLNTAEPVHPFASLATMVYEPAASPVKLPED